MSTKTFTKAIVGLDRSLMDDFILEYLSSHYEKYGIQQLHFIYSIKKPDILSDFLIEKIDAKDTIDELTKEIADKVSNYDFQSAKTTVEVHEGSPVDVLLTRAVREDCDLIVMGRKRSLKGSGIVSSHVARKSPTNILFITQNTAQSLSNILCPVDFSRHSKIAIDYGAHLSSFAHTNQSLINTYEVPLGYYKTGKSFEEFAAIMLRNAEGDFSNFKKEHKVGDELPCSFVLKNNATQQEIILEHAIKNRIDLLIIGSRGRTDASAMLLGSFAEKMLFETSEIPMLIVKQKGENMDLLQTLLHL
ncbi:MAG: universal stress protein [Bacteroidota bacterium]